MIWKRHRRASTLARRACDVAGCERAYWARGYCSPHYQRWRKYGDPGSAIIGTGKGDRQKWLQDHVRHDSEHCLMWPFSFDPNGYGAASIDGSDKLGAHRAMCIMAHGPPKFAKLHAAHICGNKWCVNPAHIRWATSRENSMDKRIHGRVMNGEKNHRSKLTVEMVSKAKSDHQLGKSFGEIARGLGLARSTVSRAIQGITWNG